MSFQSSWSVARSLVIKKTLQRNALTAAVGLVLSANALAGFPTLYGKIYLTAGQYDLEKNDFPLTAPGATTFSHLGASGATKELDTFVLESTGSRLGVQGDFDANADVQVFYRIEYGIDVDNGTNSNGRELTQRNIFGGVRGDWGSLLAGKNDTPLKTLQTNTVLRSDIDRFNDAPLADIGSYLVGENRPDNVIQYATPILLGGLEVNIAAIQAEETGVAVNATNPQNDDGFASGQSVSAVYGKSTWFVGAAFDRNVATSDVFRALGEITLGSVKLGAIYQTAERHETFDSLGGFSTFVGTNGTTLGAQNGLNPLSEWDGAAGNAYKEQDGYVVNALWKIGGPWSARIQYGHSTSTPSNDSFSDVDADALALGVDYSLSSAARVFAYYASLEAQGDAQISPQSTTDSTLALGLDFRF